jgi:thiamine-monophosphate kinase
VPGEFELIERYLRRVGAARSDVVAGVGDDAALLRPPPGYDLVATVDTLTPGVDFLADTKPSDLGYRALAVSLSDLAAMGADPAWALLALTLPSADEAWLEDFVVGFDGLARTHGVALAGGDLGRGPLSISVQALGLVPAGAALTRGGARVGDFLYVTGWPGDAAAGLALLEGRLAGSGANRAWLVGRFLRPEPRVGVGQRLRGLASSCIDVSDGLAQDLGHLARASGVAAVVSAESLPLSRSLYALVGEREAQRLALGGGDDYELLFTVPPQRRERLAGLTGAGMPACHCIGEIVAGQGVRVRSATGDMTVAGFDHFKV